MMAPTQRNPRPLVVFDGTESLYGRALLVISSLYWSRDWIDDADICFVGTICPDVRIALEVFGFDTGFDVTLPPDSDETLRQADLFAAIAFRSAEHLPLETLRLNAVPVVLAMQYPDGVWLDEPIVEGDAAFDPEMFASHVGAAVRSLI